MKRNLTIGILLFSILFTSCTNFFHNIIPPEEGVIIDFQLKYTNGSRSSSYTPDKNDNITIIVPAETDVTSLIPIVKISEKAQIVPGTLNYINKIFPEKDLLTLALDMYTANQNGTFKTWFLNLVLENDGIKIPKLEMPIDFTTPVLFIVISGQGNYKFYTVTVKKESDNNNNNDENQNDNNNDDSQEKDYENLILSFEVPSQIAESVIEHTVTGGSNEIIQDSNNLGDSVPYSGIVTFEVDENTNLKEILPIVTVSEGANVLPLTQNYLLSLGLSFEQILQFYSGYSTTSDVEKYIYSFIKKLDNITYPSLDMPINFYDTQVYFAVISANKDVKIYYINCKIKNIQPKLLNIAFSKTNNPLLIKDSKISIESQQITLSCLYPMDMELDYNLVADFVFDGDRVTYTMPTADEVEMISGVTKIPFTKNQRTCTITVYKSTKEVKYELVCPIELDPDSIRSITDFRFYKSKNTDIKKTVIASIYNEGDIGFISASVLYEGNVPPFELIPDFITPGVVTKEGVEVISGNTCENFEYKTQYLCTSKNGLYCRLYDISFEFVQIVTEEPVITSFEFPVYLNKDLSKDAVATIDDLTNTIRCEILYFTEKPPYNLTPVFASNGEVTCNSITQTSGFSEESFKYTTYYVVTTGTEEKITKRYRVDVSFVKDSSSSCDILDFTFESKNNATLSSDIQSTVTERTKSIFAFMPYGAGSQSGTLLTPTFTSNGTVSVNGQTQTSGISSQDFSSPVTYTVTSTNGLYTKEYVVSLQESGSIIYVDKNAVGRNNGTSWDDAFINLDTALEYVSTIDESILQEVWITADEYEPILNSKNGFNIRSNLILRGGFEGTESAINDRLVDSENCLVNHTVLKRQPLNSDEESLFYANENFTGTFTIDGFDIDLEQSANETFLDIIKVLNPIEATENSKIETNNCLVSVKTQNGGCRLFYSEKDSNDLWDTATKPTNNIKIANTTINAETIDGIDVTSHTGEILIQNTKTNCNLFMVGKNVTIENSSFDNQLYTVTEKPDNKFHLTNLNDSDSSAQIKNSYFNNLVIKAYHDITMEDSILENCALHTENKSLMELNLVNSNLDLIDIGDLSLKATSLYMLNSKIIAGHFIVGTSFDIENSEIICSTLNTCPTVETFYIGGNSIIRNSTIVCENKSLDGYKFGFILESSSLGLGGYLDYIGGKDNATKHFYVENSKFVSNKVVFRSENVTIKNSEFYMYDNALSSGGDFGIEVDTINFVCEGNYFDTTYFLPGGETYGSYNNNAYLKYVDKSSSSSIFFKDNLESAKIINNTFDNFFNLAIGTEIDGNYFKLGSGIGIGYYSNFSDFSLTNNTFEDVIYVIGRVSNYENNQIVSTTSNPPSIHIECRYYNVYFPIYEFENLKILYFKSLFAGKFINCQIGDYDFCVQYSIRGMIFYPRMKFVIKENSENNFFEMNNCEARIDIEIYSPVKITNSEFKREVIFLGTRGIASDSEFSGFRIEQDSDNSEIVFGNCIFEGFTNDTDTSSSYYNICYFSNNNSVTFKDCSFNSYNKCRQLLASSKWKKEKYTYINAESDATEIYSNNKIFFTGTNTMIYPTYKASFDGTTDYCNNNAIYVNGVTLQGTLY